MNIVNDNSLFTSALDQIEERNRVLLTLYQESERRILDKLMIIAAEREAGLTPSAFQEARLREMLMQMEVEIERLMAQVSREIQDTFTRIYEDTYYGEAYLFERSVNTQLALPYDYQLNYPVLNTNAINEAFSERVGGFTFSERIGQDQIVMQYRLRGAIAQTIMEGQTVKDLQKHIQLLDDIYAQNIARAQATARTELLRAFSLGAEHAADEAVQSGVEFEYIWSATLAGNTRPEHRAADGQKAKMISGVPAFRVGGVLLSSPRVTHPKNTSPNVAGMVINCRCRRLNAPYGITPTERVAQLPSGQWERQPFNRSAESWYEEHYGNAA
jgi:hypothetical protein